MHISRLPEIYEVWRDQGRKPLLEANQLLDLVLSESRSTLDGKLSHFLEKAGQEINRSKNTWEHAPDFQNTRASEVLEWCLTLRYEGYQPLRTAHAFLSVVLTDRKNNLDIEQRNHLRTTNSLCAVSADVWNYIMVYLRWKMGVTYPKQAISEILKSVRSYCVKDLYVDDVLVEIPDNLVSTQFDVIVNELLICLVLWNDKIPNTIILKISDSLNEVVQFDIQTLTSHLINEEPTLEDATIGTRLHFAKEIIDKFEGHLELEKFSRRVEFQLSLRP